MTSQICANKIVEDLMKKCGHHFKIQKWIQENSPHHASKRTINFINEVGNVIFVSPRKNYPLEEVKDPQKFPQDSFMNVSKVEYKQEEKKKKKPNRRRTKTMSSDMFLEGNTRRSKQKSIDQSRELENEIIEENQKQKNMRLEVSRQQIQQLEQKSEKQIVQIKNLRKNESFAFDYSGNHLKLQNKARHNFLVQQIKGQLQGSQNLKGKKRKKSQTEKKQKIICQITEPTYVQTNKIVEKQEKRHIRSKNRQKQQEQIKKRELQEEEQRKSLNIEFSGINDLSHQINCRTKVSFSCGNSIIQKKSRKTSALSDLQKSLVEKKITRAEYSKLKTEEALEKNKKSLNSINTEQMRVSSDRSTEKKKKLTIKSLPSNNSKIIVEDESLKQTMLSNMEIIQPFSLSIATTESQKIEGIDRISASKVDKYNIKLIKNENKYQKFLKEFRKTFLKCPKFQERLTKIKNRERLGIMEIRKKRKKAFQEELRSQKQK